MKRKKKTKVAIISTYPSLHCGIAQYTRYLVSEISKQDVEVVLLGNKGAKEKVQPERIRVLPIWQARSYRSLFRIWRAISKERPDIIHFQFHPAMYGGFLITGGILLLLRFLAWEGKKIIVTTHTIMALHRIKKNIVYKSIIKWGTRFLLGSTQRIITHTKEQREVLIREYGLESDRIVVVPMGAQELKPFPKEKAKEALGLEERLVLLSPSLLREGVGVEYVIEALKELTSRLPQAVYYILGIPPATVVHLGNDYYKRLLHLRDSLGLGKRVSFLLSSRAINEDRELWLGAADVLTYLHEDYPAEDASLSIWDSCARGKAVIVSDAPKFREVASFLKTIGAHELIIPNSLSHQEKIRVIGKAIIFVSISENRRKIQAALRQIAPQRSWDKIARQTIQIYQDLVSDE